MSRLRCILYALAFFVCAFPFATAQAHKPSDSYLTIEVNDETIEGQWDIALRELDFAIGLDADGNGALGWPVNDGHSRLKRPADV
jgi:hypothetical protein